MIKVIKHGQTQFKMICPHCGCEFTYEKEDIKYKTGLFMVHTDTYSEMNFVECPDCGYECYISGTPVNPISNTPWLPNWNLNFNSLDCDKCPYSSKRGGTPIVGDTPCTWCPKNQFTCNSTNMETKIETIKGNTSNWPHAHFDHVPTKEELEEEFGAEKEAEEEYRRNLERQAQELGDPDTGAL